MSLFGLSWPKVWKMNGRTVSRDCFDGDVYPSPSVRVCGLLRTWPLCLHERVAEIAQSNGRACVCELLPAHGVERDDEATLG